MFYTTCLFRYCLLYCLLFLLWIQCHSSSFTFSHPSFLKTTYPVKTDVNKRFYVRQVPGDGSCLFHSIAVWISFIRYGKHYRFDWRMRSLSTTLRQLAVEMLKTNQTFFVENNETITTTDLLAYASEYSNTTVKEYIDKMTRTTEWGGGPEIVALCNHFKCPIHVYELSTQGIFPKEFCLQMSAKFGSPSFDDKLPICILHADGRFPYLDVNKFSENQAKEHFLALFPCEDDENDDSLRRAKRPYSYFSSFFLRSSSSPSSSSSQATASSLPASSSSSEPVITAHNSVDSSSGPLPFCNLEKCPEFSEDMTFFKKKAKNQPSPTTISTLANTNNSSNPFANFTFPVFPNLDNLLPNFHSLFIFSKNSLCQFFGKGF